MRDRIPTHAGRIKLTSVDAANGIYDMVRADDPVDEGTPLNKNTFLTDETAEALGLDPENDPTPDDALYSLAGKVGDVRETLRTDLGDKWILCNGEIVPDGTYPELRDVLRYNTSWRRFAQFDTEYTTVRPLPVAGQWALLDLFVNTQIKGKTAVLYDGNTDTYTEIMCPTIDTTVRYGIFGLTHDGTQYVLGVNEDENDSVLPKIHLFTSTDLVTWTDRYQFEAPSAGYTPTDLNCDGTGVLVLADYYSSNYSTYVFAVSLDFSSHETRMSNNFDDRRTLEVYPGGYWRLAYDGMTSAFFYNPGTTITAIRPTIATGFGGLAFFSEKYWLGAPLESGEMANTIDVFDVETLAFSYLSLYGKIEAEKRTYLNGMEYNRNDNMWLMYFSVSGVSGNPDSYYIGYISADKNPADIVNYTFVRVVALPENIPFGQMANDRTYFREDSGRYIKDPNQKYLPTHDGDTYKYIYVG